MIDNENKYKPFPFWSWNDELDEKELIRQIDWMHDNGIGGFFMHARGGLKTDYLSPKWFDMIKACLKRAKELNMEAYAYDENGWPSGFVGGKLLEDPNNHDMMITYFIGEYDSKAAASYDISTDKVKRVSSGKNVMNVYLTNTSSTCDVLNKKVVDKFIKLTHEEYKKNDIYGNLKGFFTDEPQYFRWNTAYTRVLPQYFKDKYNEDIFDRLALLFIEKDGYRDFRYKYWKAMQDLMLTNYCQNIYEWCDRNNYIFTGHYIEETKISSQMWCCAGIMPMYEYQHIPGIDYLGRNIVRSASAKQLGSVAEQLNKKQRMAEIFACSGWDATPNELRVLAEYVMVGGVNIICHHLLPYSEHGQRKRDYPEHFSSINPWVNKNFKEFNDYFTKIGKLLAESKEIANVGILHPIRSAYFDYKYDLNDSYYRHLSKITDSFLQDNLLFEQLQLPFHYLDETIMSKHAKVIGKQLVVGNCKYDYIIIPHNVITMDRTTEALFKEYIANGGKILLLDEKPLYLEGDKYDYGYLNSNTSFEEIISSQEIQISRNDNVVSSYHFDINGNKYIYLINLGDKTNIEIKNKDFKNLLIDGISRSNKLFLDKYESKIIYFTNEDVVALDRNEEIILGNNFKVKNTDHNYLNIDNVSFSIDGIEYSKQYPTMFVLDKLIKEKYKGQLFLKYTFDVHEIPSICNALIENTNTIYVKINGHKVKKQCSVLEKDLLKYDIVNHLAIGVNEIVICIDFYEKDDVFTAIYGEGVTESLKNCLAYDTTIEPIYLEGDFGVFGDFSELNNCFVANNFYLDKQVDKVSTIIKDGFPFFRGDIVLSQKINIKKTNCVLKLNQRFQLVDVFVNGTFVDRLMFKNYIDISKYLKIGENEITLILTVSNRNLLGPHHALNEEPMGVGPETFERFKSWDNHGNSPRYLQRYSFVKIL